ncbi:MAG TPA: Uma2 family endonuclease [Chloroflexota bacterium]|nr:Uma2 family endonuclease [Chloroflexota bacterium]
MAVPRTPPDNGDTPGMKRAQLERLAGRAADPRDPTTISYHAFLEWADEDTLAEWVNGKIEVSSPAGLRHQQLVQFLSRLLAAYVETYDLGSIVLPPFQMKLPGSGREPDLLFIAKERQDRVRDGFLDGPADLVVEIISPESSSRDRITKLAEYEHGGIPEYWLIDPRARGKASFYQRTAQGRYDTMLTARKGMYYSKAIRGLWLDLAWLWQKPLPDLEDTLLAVAGQAYAEVLLSRLRARGFLPPEP